MKKKKDGNEEKLKRIGKDRKKMGREVMLEN